MVNIGDLGKCNWPIWGLPAADLAFASRGIIPPARIILRRTENLTANKGTGWRFKDVVCFLVIDYPRPQSNPDR